MRPFLTSKLLKLLLISRKGGEGHTRTTLSAFTWKIVSNDGLILSCWTSVIIRGCLLSLPTMASYWPQAQCFVFGISIPTILLIDFRKRILQTCRSFYWGQKQQSQMQVSVYLTSASRPLTSITQMEDLLSDNETPK